MNKKALYKLSYGVYIVGSGESGCVINTLNQIASPNIVSISVNKENYTNKVIKKTKYFNVTVVTEDTDMDVIRKFGFTSSKDHNKFNDFKTAKDSHDNVYLSENMAALLECEVINEVDLGSHTLFIAKVVNSTVLSDKAVMTYEYYHKVKKGITPPKAPSYIEEKKPGYKCMICGYIYEGEELPEDFVCPICGAPASAFKKIEL